MKLEPAEQDKKISPIFIVAYTLFLFIPFLALYKGWQSHNIIAMIGSFVGIIGFSFLLTVTIRHNRKISKREKTDN